MAFDAHKNLAIATVATAPSPSTSGTTLSVATGEGARFPAAPFNATVWPVSQPPTPVTAEVVRVTAIAGDTLTITRAQEATTARSIVAGDLIAATITAKTLTDLESGTNFAQLATTGDLVISGSIHPPTTDGADTGILNLLGGGAVGDTRGARLALNGNEGPGPGQVSIMAGNTPTSGIVFFTGASATRGKIHATGGFSWAGTTDPGDGLIVGGPYGAGNAFSWIRPSGDIRIGINSASALSVMVFLNPNGSVGSITCSGSSTTYATTSDERLKDDRGVVRIEQSGDVLRQTVVHEFTWKVDGTPGRGVFAQEAVAVAPFAVTVGTDETDEAGHLMQPWGVDYAKYVPDLIVGWQHHDAQVAALAAAHAALSARVSALEARLTALEAGLPPAQG